MAERTRRAVGEEYRGARIAAGMTLTQAGQPLGWSRQRAARLERGRIACASLDDMILYASVLGLRLAARAFPAGAPLRDVGQLAVTRRFRARLAQAWRVTLEMPLPIRGDLRAFDLLLRRGEVRVFVEVITRLTDAQAQLRALHLKWRDGAGGAGRLVVILADSKHNREALAGVGDLLADDFPLSTRALMGALARGRDPEANGIALV